MNKLFATIAAALLCCTFNANAQESAEPSQLDLEPGIYAIVDGQATALSYSNGTAVSSSSNILGFELGKSKVKYKGATSGVQATDKLVLVLNPEKKNITKTFKKYDPFVKTMTPKNIMVIPLTVDGDRRIYDEGTSIEGFNVEQKDRAELEWEQTGDYTYEVRFNLVPGEYAVVFKAAKLADYDFEGIFGFTISE